ncbi:hypothetical protein [Candidatus Mesenet endosymbiont of Agriotes lineatus]|uniref:hypothetical protein n=1 Tax=Candidatus Mesenet endosymbiont of Agriotes lineatus TaxID=3077948 RepID=UPI0030CFC896
MDKKRLSRTIVLKILERVKRDLSMVCIASDQHEIQYLKSKVYNYIDKLGTDHINNEDSCGKTILDLIIEVDSKGQSRLNNPILIELEKYAKNHGAIREEFSPFEIERYIFRSCKRARIEDMSPPEREEYISNLSKRVIDNVNTYSLERIENRDFFTFCIASLAIATALAIHSNNHNRDRLEHIPNTILEQANTSMLSATTKEH